MKVLGAFFVNVLFNFAIGLLVAKFLGPAEYGRFALALATAMAVQALFLDWLRLGATRFYSERARDEDPGLRSTLDIGFAIITVGLGVSSAILFSTGISFPLSNGLIALGLGAAVANGLFDFNTALVRARFHDTLYIRLILIKNVLAFGLTGGGAFYFASAKMALVGGIVSLVGSVVFARAALSDPGATARLAQVTVARSILRYATPIVAANVLYICIPLANRSVIAIFYGFSETGQFSLAYDIGTKAIQAIGSTLDVLLFQIAVAAHDSHGHGESKQRIADNMAIMVAIILPSCMGIWLVMPSLQVLIVPVQYRGPFEQLLTLMMPGLFCFGMIVYAVSPIFQIAKRTGPLIIAAIAGCIADPLILLSMPHMRNASGLAIAQSGGFACALATLIALACLSNPIWPKLRDLVFAALATGAMTAILLPLRSQTPGFLILVTQIASGMVVYAALVFLFDIAGLRTLVLDRLHPLVSRFRPS